MAMSKKGSVIHTYIFDLLCFMMFLLELLARLIVLVCSLIYVESLESDHYCRKSYFKVSVSKPSAVQLGTLTVHHLLWNIPTCKKNLH